MSLAPYALHGNSSLCPSSSLPSLTFLLGACVRFTVDRNRPLAVPPHNAWGKTRHRDRPCGRALRHKHRRNNRRDKLRTCDSPGKWLTLKVNELSYHRKPTEQYQCKRNFSRPPPAKWPDTSLPSRG